MMLENPNSKIIMIIDDEKDFVEMLTGILEKRGYEVYSAFNGEEAMQKVSKIKPDLILLDIRMPKMGGVAFYDRICLPNCQPMYPVLIVSACENLEELFQNLPVEGFIAKPVKIDALLVKIASIFDKNQQSKDKNQSSSRAQRKVLLVENDEATISKLVMSFLHQGYMVGVAKSAKEAIERIIDPDLPDLVLVRHGIPGDPEYTIPYYLRGMPQARKVRVACYVQNLKMIDPMKEREIINFVGEKNLFDLEDMNYVMTRCERLLTPGTKAT